MHSVATMIGPAALATKEFRINQQPDTEGRYVRIVGRSSGLMDFLLNIIGVDTTTTFEVFSNHIRFRSSNLSGSHTTVLPLTAVSSTTCGFFKPVLYLVLGILLLPVLIGIVFIIYYFLHKSLLVSVQSHSSATAAIAFKRSVVEGVTVDEAQAQRVGDLVNWLVLQTRPR